MRRGTVIVKWYYYAISKRSRTYMYLGYELIGYTLLPKWNSGAAACLKMARSIWIFMYNCTFHWTKLIWFSLEMDLKSKRMACFIRLILTTPLRNVFTFFNKYFCHFLGLYTFNLKLYEYDDVGLHKSHTYKDLCKLRKSFIGCLKVM
jgi:hypothetical protein